MFFADSKKEKPKNTNTIVSAGRYSFPVNCDDCSYLDVKHGCAFSRCIYLELPKPNSLTINKSCSICGGDMVRPIYSNVTICESCTKKLKELIGKDGEADDGK